MRIPTRNVPVKKPKSKNSNTMRIHFKVKKERERYTSQNQTFHTVSFFKKKDLSSEQRVMAAVNRERERESNHEFL